MVAIGIKSIKDEAILLIGIINHIFHEQSHVSFVLDGRLIEISLNHVCHIDMIIAYIIFK